MFARRHPFAGATALALVATTAAAAATHEGASPQLRAYSAAADTYVTAAQPTANYGRSLTLRAEAEPQATTFLRFELGKPLADDATAILLLHAQTGRRASYQVRRVSPSPWRERRLTFANAPKLSLRYSAGKQMRQGAWNAVDVTSFVGGSVSVSLAITSRSSKGIVFHSRESKLGPRLVVRTGEGVVDIKQLLPLP